MKKNVAVFFSSESCPFFSKQNQNSTFIAAKVQIYSKLKICQSINIILDIYNVFLISSVEGNLTPRQAEHFFLVLSCLFPRGEGAGAGRGVRGGGGYGAYGVLTSDFKWEG